MKKILAFLGLIGATFAVTACNDAAVVSANISKDADNFKIPRRIVFYNGITDSYMLSVEGYCSFNRSKEHDAINVICKDALGYKKHTLVLSDNVTAFSEQLKVADVSPNHYKVVFKPSVIVPTIEVR